MKVYFVLPGEVHEKLLQLADEVGDTNQVVIQAINQFYERVFEVTSTSSSTEEEQVKGTKELKDAINQLERKITKIQGARRAPAQSEQATPEIETPEIQETESASSRERPALDGMLDDVVVTPDSTKKSEKKKDKENKD